MKLIPRYLISQLSVMTLYALLALLALYSFFDVMNEIGDVGKGSYTGAKMMQYVLLQLPSRVYELLPLAVLIGGLLALSQLAARSELTVIKTSGMSTGEIIRILLSFGLIFAALTVFTGEWGAPAASRYAANMKAGAIEGKISAGNGGLWVKEQRDIINIKEMLPDRSLHGITIFQHDDDFRLTAQWHADSAVVQANGSWQLKNVRRSLLEADRVRVETRAEETLQTNMKPNLLDVLLVDPNQMSLTSLTSYISHLKANHQEVQAYRIAWWRKFFYPIAAVVMALVALAFTPQSTRQGNMGLKLFFGICLGLAFHFAGRLFSFTSQLYGIPPFLAAALPTTLFAILAVWLIRKHEKR